MFAEDRARDGGRRTLRGGPRCAGTHFGVICLVLGASLVWTSGCGGPDGDGAGGAGGQGGSGLWGEGGLEAPCVEVMLHNGILEEPLASGSPPVAWPRQPFWRDERGLHVAWAHSELTDGVGRPVHLLVSSFDPLTGEVLQHRVYDPWPPEVAIAGASVFAVAGSPEGSFAAAIGYGDDTAPDGFAIALVLGHLDQEGELQSWVSPWSSVTWHPFHAAWDGAAFLFEFFGTQGEVLAVRLAPDGSEMGAPTVVGAITTFWDDQSSFRTDPATGITWLASEMDDGGVWLTGHQRDGSALSWLGPEGWTLVEPQGVAPMEYGSQNPALAVDGERALVAWGTNDRSTTHAQMLNQGEETGDSLLLFDNIQGTGPFVRNKQLERFDGGWWLGASVTDFYHDMPVSAWGIQSFWLGDTPEGSVELTGRSALVGWPPCWPGCDKDMLRGFNLRYPASLSYQDEIWYGFWDGTNTTLDIDSAYRIVRVGRSCRYPTLFEIYHPELMPPDTHR